jgi:hypothetical protein
MCINAPNSATLFTSRRTSPAARQRFLRGMPFHPNDVFMPGNLAGLFLFSANQNFVQLIVLENCI